LIAHFDSPQAGKDVAFLTGEFIPTRPLKQADKKCPSGMKNVLIFTSFDYIRKNPMI
jgi:hypothetical protein